MLHVINDKNNALKVDEGSGVLSDTYLLEVRATSVKSMGVFFHGVA